MYICIYLPTHTHTHKLLYPALWRSWAQRLVSVSCGVCLCVMGGEGGLLADLLAEDGKAAAVWIKGSVLVSDKHWISAVISPLLAQAWNWEPGLSSPCVYAPAWIKDHRKELGLVKTSSPVASHPVMRLVIKCGTITLPMNANHCAPGVKDEHCCVLHNVFIHFKWQVCHLPWHRDNEVESSDHMSWIFVFVLIFVYDTAFLSSG